MRPLTLVLVALFVLLLGCSRPVPPTLQPERVDVNAASTAGLVLRVHVRAHNPNSYPLPVRSVVANVTMSGNPMAQVTAGSIPTLAANADTPVDFDVVVPWTSLGAAIALAQGGNEIPYIMDGTAHFSAAGVEIPVHFKFSGTVKKSDVIAGIMHTRPGKLPFPIPSGLP